jgi:hypothetical protein
MSAKRAHERKKVCLPVTYAHCGENAMYCQKGTTCDISCSGMCFLSDKPLRKGLSLNIHVPKIWNVPRPCIVKWSNMERSHRWRVGVAFLEVHS